MTGDQIAWLGIVLTVLFGVGGFLVAKKVRRRQQNQTVLGSGSAIQAGRDVTIKDSATKR